MSKPHLELVHVCRRCVHDDASDLEGQVELFANQSEQQVLPKQVRMPSPRAEAPGPSLRVRWVLPHGFYTLHKHIDNSFLIILTWPFDVLVHVPKLFNRRKAGQWLQLLFVKIVALLLARIHGESLMQLRVLRGLRDASDCWVVNNLHN